MAEGFALAFLFAPINNVNMGKKDLDNETISISKASEILGISEATVKNWVKLGKLSCISRRPYVFLRADIMRLHKTLDTSEYLKSRRNKTRNSENYIPKSYIDSNSPNYPIIKALIGELTGKHINVRDIIHAYARSFCMSKDIPAGVIDSLLGKAQKALPVTFLDEYPLNYIEGEDTLGMLYISLRRLQEKKSTGSYYTPFYVVDKIVVEAFPKDLPSDMKLMDPACGTGNFLLRLPKGLLPKNVYGSDIDPEAVAIARINLVLKYNIRTASNLDTIKSHILLQDFLKNNSGRHFDLMIGNPPWGFVYSKKEQKVLKELFVSYTGDKNPESFSLFIEKSLESLAENGVMSFLLPESILDVRLHTAIRSLMLGKAQVLSIHYLGEVFDKVQCPCVILTLKKTSGKAKDYKTEVSFSKAKKSKLITKKSFTAGSGRLTSSSFQLICDDAEYALLKKIESVPHFTLEGNADFALGIVTGSNKTLLSDTALVGYEPVITGKELTKYSLLPARKYMRFTPESFQQCAPEKFYRAKEKLFYRFIADEPVIAIDEEGLVSLNSANIIIPHMSGYSARYIMAILNSSVMSFYYRHRFRNMKVLRSALEMLPIAKCPEADQKRLSELTMQSDPAEIDKIVASLYDITDEELALLLRFKVL